MEYNKVNLLWSSQQQKHDWAIERSERRICFGNPGYVDEWVYHSFYETEEEAKIELDRLLSFVDPLSRRSYRIINTKVFSYNVKG